MTNACACGKPAPHAYLCGTCASRLGGALSTVPTLVTDLDLTLTKQRRFGDPNTGSRATDHGLPYNTAAAAVLADLRLELSALVRLCLTHGLHAGPQPGSHPTAMSVWLLARLAPLTTQPWATDALRVIALVGRGEEVIDAPPERTFAGPCNQCGTDLYARAGQAHATCPTCGDTYDLATRRTWLLGMVDDRLATATDIARALTSLELPVTAERIRQWKHRHRITPVARDQLGHPLFRVGDVVDLLIEYAERAG